MALKCFSDGTDTVVAESEQDAYAVWKETIGASYHDEAAEGERLLELPDDKVLTITNDEAPEGEEKVSMTCAQWAEQTGRDFLCSTEF